MQFAMSRRRELLADASGVQLTRYPPGLISALEEAAGRPGGRPPRHPRHRADVDREPARARPAGGTAEATWAEEGHVAQPRVRHPPAARRADRSAGGDVNRTRPTLAIVATDARGGAGRVRRQRRLEGRHQEEAGRVHDHDHRRHRRSRRSPGCPIRTARRRADPCCRSRSTTTAARRDRRPASTPPTSCGTRSSRARPRASSRCSSRRSPDVVGPVRSVRLTDPLIVWPVGGVFAYSGGAKYAVDAINQAPVDAHRRERAPATRCSATPAGGAPHNLYAKPPRAVHARAARRCRRRRCSTTPRRRARPGRRASVGAHRVREPGVRAHLHVGRGVGHLEALDARGTVRREVRRADRTEERRRAPGRRTPDRRRQHRRRGPARRAPGPCRSSPTGTSSPGPGPGPTRRRR